MARRTTPALRKQGRTALRPDRPREGSTSPGGIRRESAQRAQARAAALLPRLFRLVLILALVGGLPALPDVKDLLNPPRAEAHPACVPPDEPHYRVAYVHDVSKPSRFAENATKIVAAVVEANRVFRAAGADVAVECDKQGAVRVRELALAIEGSPDRYAALHASLPCDGPYRWLVAYDGANGTSFGSSAVDFDDDPDPATNPNNRPCRLAVVWGASGSGPYAHELAHSLGAAMRTCPHCDGGGHVHDEGDVLNGGRVLDVGKDDYFDPDPAPGSYLDTHWNGARSSFVRLR